MSLFPAYGQDGAAGSSPAREVEVECGAAVARWDVAESELLASSDSEPDALRESAPPRAEPEPDFYVDRRFDGGNLRVSTIYYPGRPEYKSMDTHFAIGLKDAVRSRRKRTRRYWEAGAGQGRGEGQAEGQGQGQAEGEEAGERGAALRRALVERPRDEQLWLQYIDYQEWVFGAAAGASAAEAAAARLPRACAVRARRHAALRRALSAQDYLARLRDELAEEKEPGVVAELWVRLVEALARAPAAGVSGACAAAAAAARHTRRLPEAYPALLYQYGTVMRAAGLWETLVLLLELLLPVGAAPTAAGAAFPPPRDEHAERAAEARLQDYEDKVVSSGLPSGAMWARVERARGAAHWRPARAAAADADADPQRAPALADVADLLLPCAGPQAALLPLLALRLAKVPLLPSAQYVSAACGPSAEPWDCGEALLALVRAARRLPPQHAARARPEHARALVQRAVDPPHYFSDDYGYRSWVEALWEAALSAVADTGGAESALAALLCWRLRWLHAQLLLLEDSPEFAAERRRIRDAAQASLRRWGGAHALPFAQFARVAHAHDAERGAGLRAATVALRAAIQDRDVPHHQLLYIARIVCEVSAQAGRGSCGAPSAAGACALACAALRSPLPDALHAPPALLQQALDECERRCAALEEEMEAEDSEHSEPESELGSGARLLRALLPGEAEWAAARALLAPPPRCAALLRHALTLQAGRGRALRWREQQASALVLRAPRATTAAPLSLRYPDNALLALVAGGAGAWAGGVGGAVPGGADSAVRQLGGVWATLLRACGSGWAARAAGELARRLRRLRGDCAGALLWALRLEAEARAPRPRLERVAHAAMDALPQHKWLCVRCAALGAAGGGGALPDVVLERGLRLHALPDELRALQPDPGAHAHDDADTTARSRSS